MSSQDQALERMLQAINALREAGYNKENMAELAGHAREQLENDGDMRRASKRRTQRVRLYGEGASSQQEAAAN